MKIKNKILTLLYWSPYIPILGFIFVILYSMTSLKNYLCFESDYINPSDRAKLKKCSLHFSLTLLIQMISTILLIYYYHIKYPINI